MNKESRMSVAEVLWADPCGRKMRLNWSAQSELEARVDEGAVEVWASGCILTRLAIPGGEPEIAMRVDQYHITVALSNCQINWA